MTTPTWRTNEGDRAAIDRASRAGASGHVRAHLQRRSAARFGVARASQSGRCLWRSACSSSFTGFGPSDDTGGSGRRGHTTGEEANKNDGPQMKQAHVSYTN